MDFHVLLSLFVQYGYLLVFFLVLLDNAAVSLPGELVLLGAGVLAEGGHLDLRVGVLAAAVGAVGGDSLGYWLGP